MKGYKGNNEKTSKEALGLLPVTRKSHKILTAAMHNKYLVMKYQIN